MRPSGRIERGEVGLGLHVLGDAERRDGQEVNRAKERKWNERRLLATQARGGLLFPWPW